MLENRWDVLDTSGDTIGWVRAENEADALTKAREQFGNEAERVAPWIV